MEQLKNMLQEKFPAIDFENEKITVRVNKGQ